MEKLIEQASALGYDKPSDELLSDMLPGEVVYPIIQVEPKWSIDITKDVSDLGPNWFKNLPEGRMWIGTSWYEMSKDSVRTPKVIITEVEDTWWPKLKDEYNSKLEKVEVKFKRWETWAITWFSHWTWDLGMNDRWVRDSFGRYVERTKRTNYREGKTVDGLWCEPYCLMDAEDRWRWHGTVDGSPNGEETAAPCRCIHCKKREVVTINH